MPTTAYATQGLPPAPEVSLHTMHMVGFLVDVYGLEELPPSAPVTCLWLLHPRTHSRAIMNDIARRAVHAWNQSTQGKKCERGLVALVADMPNHGSRMVSEVSNQDWRHGNPTHGIDMPGMIIGGVSDTSALMDYVAGYLQRDVDAHVCLGWSLGGHMAWQAWLGEERMDAAVVIVGCPDMMRLLGNRATFSKLDLDGKHFLGSKYFPPDLLAKNLSRDPKGLLFGTGDVPQVPVAKAEQDRLRPILESRVRGKRLLLCSGAEDKLVPYKDSEPVIRVLQEAASGWADGSFSVSDKLYKGAGHEFRGDMVADSVAFIVDAVAHGPREKRHKAKI